MELVWGLAIPFLGTALGSAMVFFMKNLMNKKLEKLLLGFASGVMIAASVWSLLIPSIDMAKEQNIVEWLPASLGFLLGMFFLLVLDSIIPHLHLNSDKPEGLKAKLQKTTMMVLAVTLHNIPEGIAVGVVLAGAMIYVVVEELIPESHSGEHSNIGTIGVAIGFVIMMILDVALG